MTSPHFRPCEGGCGRTTPNLDGLCLYCQAAEEADRANEDHEALHRHHPDEVDRRECQALGCPYGDEGA